MNDLVELLDESDRLEVFVSAILIGDPLSRLPRVVEVQHGGDGIHAQAVDMVLVQPEHRAGKQEGADFIAPEIVNQGPPVLMLALAWILMFVKARAVEERSPWPSLGKCPPAQSRMTPMPA